MTSKRSRYSKTWSRAVIDLRSIPLGLFLCAAAACSPQLSLPIVGEPFEPIAWNASHPEGRFARLGALDGERDVFRLYRYSTHGAGIEPMSLGIIVEDGKVRDHIVDEAAINSMESFIAKAREQRDKEQLQTKQREFVTTYKAPPAYESTSVPVHESFGGSPIIKGLFLGMTMEQAVDNLNNMLQERIESGQSSRIPADWPGSFGVEYDQLPLNPQDQGKGYNMVDKRILIECLRPSRQEDNGGRYTNTDHDRECSTDKHYIVNRYRINTTGCSSLGCNRKKTVYRDIYPSPEGVRLTFNQHGHLTAFSLDQKIFNAQGLSLKEFASAIFEAYKIPVSQRTLLSGPNSGLNTSNLGRLVNFYLEDSGYEFLGEQWKIRVSSDNLLGTSIWVGQMQPKAVPSFN